MSGASTNTSTDGMDVDTPVPEARLPPKMRKMWIAQNVARLRDRSAHREPAQDMDEDTPAVDHDGEEMEGKRESYFGASLSCGTSFDVVQHLLGRLSRYASTACPALADPATGHGPQ